MEIRSDAQFNIVSQKPNISRSAAVGVILSVTLLLVSLLLLFFYPLNAVDIFSGNGATEMGFLGNIYLILAFAVLIAIIVIVTFVLNVVGIFTSSRKSIPIIGLSVCILNLLGACYVVIGLVRA